ncbi:serine/threonine-protein kinase [Spelaeicoccus albus]|uniref:Protein kinase domain-containing protein n=1 Tax=Spelaeicoccus albus TaxID=1280376 RepID=A0A7Z0A9B4_9MICO|nr:serine/threonine-protein kinase [Spelaeicoccus albus]NYI65958.1 hypothetical protein [Spelaeicoccus albus]
MTGVSSIDGYQVCECLGQGGMGVVHRAIDAAGNQVAIKVLHPHVAIDPEARRRLAREVHTLQKVRHPRVAEVIDAELDAETPFLVTQYVPGPSLSADVGESGPFSEAELVHLGHGLLDALSAVHAVDVVHRDLKPANVMLLDGEPVVIDFGIAQAADDVQITATGLVMGTPGYLSPEVAAGNPSTPATDWWGWGAVMAFAATGRNPFGSGPIEAILGRVQGGDPDLEGAPERFRGLLRACLDPEPARRPNGDAILGGLVDIESGRMPDLPTPDRSAAGDGPDDAPTTVSPASGGPGEAPTVAAAAIATPSGSPSEALTEAAPAANPVARPASGAGGSDGMTRAMPAANPGATASPGDVRGLGYDQHDPAYDEAGRPTGHYPAQAQYPAPYPGQYPYQDPRQFPAQQQFLGPPPMPPRRSGTVAALFAAVIMAFTLGPGIVLVAVLAWSLLARTVGRAWQLRRWRRYAQGSAGTMATIGSIPGSFILSIITTVFTSILPAIAGTAAAAIVWFLGSGTVPSEFLTPGTLACSAFIILIVAWWGPGGNRLRDGSRAIVRTCSPGSWGRFVLAGAFLAIAVIAAGLALGGSEPTWWPVGINPFVMISQVSNVR